MNQEAEQKKLQEEFFGGNDPEAGSDYGSGYQYKKPEKLQADKRQEPEL